MADFASLQTRAMDFLTRLRANTEHITPGDRKQVLQLCGISFVLWLIGRLDFSFAWVVIALTTFTLWQMQQARKRLKRKHIQMANNAAAMSKLDLPSWVFFPASEKADWVNKVIAQMWPYISGMVKKILKESVEPAVQQSMPSSLQGLYFEKITLGNKSPTIGGMKSYMSDEKPDEYILDLDLIYAGDATIKLNVKTLTMGIRDITLRGKLRVIFKPLVADYNPVGGLTVFFINRPHIDFNLTNALNVLDAPGLNGKLRHIASDVIASFVVLPNRVAVPMAEGVDPSDLTYPTPEGVLRVNVFEASDLINTDITGKSDPYAKVEIGAQTFRTKVKDNTLNPVWNETFDAFIDNTEGQELSVFLFDKDTTSKDTKMGMIETDIASVVKEGKKDIWLPLEKVKKGRMRLKLNWLVLSDSALDLKSPVHDESVAMVMVKIISAKDLPQLSSTPYVYCKVTVGDTTHQTYPLATEDLTWKQMFRFLLNKPTSQNVEIEVIETKGTKMIGRLSFALGRLIHTESMEHEEELILIQRDKRIQGTLTCRFTLRALVTPLVRARTLSKKKPSSNNNKTEEVTDGVAPEVPVVNVNGKEFDDSFEFEERYTSYTGSIYDSSSRDGSLDDITNEKGEVEITLKYNHLRNRLVVKIHKARDLVSRDAASHTSPRVRVYLLPDRSSKSRRETEIVKSTLNPVFNSTFEYPVGLDMLRDRKLDVAVKNERVHLLTKRSRHFLGHVIIDLSKIDLTNGDTSWYSIS